MKSIKLIITVIIFTGLSTFTYAQTVNGEKVDTEIMEVWAFVKPFNTKESYFMDFGQKKFRPHYYDHKTQIIKNNEGEAFKKGEWMRLYSFLKKEGWVKGDERESKIGNVKGRIITFEKL